MRRRKIDCRLLEVRAWMSLVEGPEKEHRGEIFINKPRNVTLRSLCKYTYISLPYNSHESRLGEHRAANAKYGAGLHTETIATLYYCHNSFKKLKLDTYCGAVSVFPVTKTHAPEA